MKNLIPAVQLFTLREFTQTKEGLENCFKRIRTEMDCDAVQISCIGRDIPASFIAALSKEYAIKICITHAPPDLVFSKDLDVYRKLIKDHQTYGCNILGVGNSIPRYIDDGYAGFKRMLHDIAPLLSELKANGMKFAYHSHTYEFVKDPQTGRYIYDMLVEDTDPDVFHFIQDSSGCVMAASIIKNIWKRSLDVSKYCTSRIQLHDSPSVAMQSPISVRSGRETSIIPPFWMPVKRQAFNILLSSRIIVSEIPSKA